MVSRLPSEEVIAREMKDAGLDRFPAIRRIQQRNQILADLRRPERRASR